MFQINEDNSIYLNRGDILAFSVSATNGDGTAYKFDPADVLTMKVYAKKDCTDVVLSEDFSLTEEEAVSTENMWICLNGDKTKFGDVISKPKDYWYEIVLNEKTNPQTIIGYFEDGPALLKLFPEGAELPEKEITPEDIPVVDSELNLSSNRPVENRAISRAIYRLSAISKETQKEFSEKTNSIAKEVAENAKNLDEKISVEKSRIDNIVTGNTPADSELLDVRVGANAFAYASAGTAVREQFASVTGDIDALKEDVEFDIVVGTITNGVEEPHANRARFKQKIRACRTVVTIQPHTQYRYGYSVYDENGVWDGVDHGWNLFAREDANGNAAAAEIVIDKGYFSMNFKCINECSFIDYPGMIEELKSLISIKQYNFLHDLEEVKEELGGLAATSEYGVEVGTITNGVEEPHANRARFTERVKVNENTVATISEIGNYMYGYSFYDENGNWDGVDNGWNSPVYNPTVEFKKDGYVKFNFRRADDGAITETDLSDLANILNISTKKTVSDLVLEVNELSEKIGKFTENKNGMDSIELERGRYKGASYVFARIPKTTNEGKQLRPKLRFTSVDGSFSGSKYSALTFAKRNHSIFTLNAGLFNTNTLLPVGQTIIDGVSYVNTPMVDDMGAPISDKECYPLCIDAEGNLSAPYSRSVNTTEMINDGVVYAVTGWGKVVDDFSPCDDTVKNEIVHSETYIRQVVGQFQNGDYFVCTVDKSRGSVQNEAGLTYEDLAQMLIDRGVKFAYSLDGGGSAETVIGMRQLNPIYEGTVGRSIPTVLVFEY